MFQPLLTHLMPFHGSSNVALSSNGAPLSPEEIIARLRVRPNLKILNLNYNSLGGEGSKVLFRWLAYGDNHEESNDCPLEHLTNVSLTGASLGDTGFSAFVEWLERLKKRHQMTMRISLSSTPDGIHGLLLQDNNISGTSELALSFVSALSFHTTEPPYIFSSLSYLNLSSNPLSSEFKHALFSSLPSLPSLRKVFLSLTGLNPNDADAIAAYISQCRLTEFNASANKIGYKGLKKIVKAVKRCWTLEKVEIYANRGNFDEEISGREVESPQSPDLSDSFSGIDDKLIGTRIPLLEAKLKRILSRNLCMKHVVRKQAFELLKCSRLILLNHHLADDPSHSEPDLLVELVAKEVPHHSSCSIHQHNCQCLPTFHHPHSNSPVPPDDLHASNPHSPFARLPIEIQLMILSLLAPKLSSSQLIRIFEHAIDKATLPDLSLRLPSFDGRRTSGRTGPIMKPSDSPTIHENIEIHFRERHSLIYVTNTTEKQRWLDFVGCDAYDPNP